MRANSNEDHALSSPHSRNPKHLTAGSATRFPPSSPLKLASTLLVLMSCQWQVLAGINSENETAELALRPTKPGSMLRVDG